MAEVMQQHDELILASASPRRRELLRQAGIAHRVVPPPLEEPGQSVLHLAPARQAEALAYFKASAVARRHPCALILGADTIVAVGEEVLGKPLDADDGRRMLRTLSGTRHRVITGVALLKGDQTRLICSATTRVTMRPIAEQEIEDYIRSGEWEGKAGAYAIQETADRFVIAIEGAFDNVVGLPVELLQRMLAEIRDHGSAHHIP